MITYCSQILIITFAVFENNYYHYLEFLQDKLGIFYSYYEANSYQMKTLIIINQ